MISLLPDSLLTAPRLCRLDTHTHVRARSCTCIQCSLLRVFLLICALIPPIDRHMFKLILMLWMHLCEIPAQALILLLAPHCPSVQSFPGLCPLSGWCSSGSLSRGNADLWLQPPEVRSLSGEFISAGGEVSCRGRGLCTACDLCRMGPDWG